ncbi:MAG TPA: hypothetical protein VI408_03935 [Gaiellaceae bacterium]
MPNISGNAAIDVLVGLFFLFFLLSIVCSAVNEAISSILNLRALDLERGIVNLIGSERAKQFFEHWRIRMLSKPPGVIFRGVRKPSYVPARVFAATLVDLLHQPAGGPPTTDGIRDKVAEVTAAVESIPEPHLKALLTDALTAAVGDADAMVASIERSFDDVMERASGWYKRRIQIILFVIALALVGATNADSFATAQRLWKDDAVRAAVVAQADRAVAAGKANCQSAGGGAPGGASSSVSQAADCVTQVQSLGLPFGWSRATSPHDLSSALGKIVGLLVTVFALSLGAPFWFDLLGKVANLRGSGPAKPPTSSTNAPVTDS